MRLRDTDSCLEVKHQKEESDKISDEVSFPFKGLYKVSLKQNFHSATLTKPGSYTGVSNRCSMEQGCYIQLFKCKVTQRSSIHLLVHSSQYWPQQSGLSQAKIRSQVFHLGIPQRPKYWGLLLLSSPAYQQETGVEVEQWGLKVVLQYEIPVQQGNGITHCTPGSTLL